jgi:cytokinesis protein
MTAIPYDAVSADGRPQTVTYLPKGDQKPLPQQPAPSHVNKASARDFHQYPVFAAVPPTPSQSGPSGPRPPPGGLHTGSAPPPRQQHPGSLPVYVPTNPAGDARQQQYARGESMASQGSANGNQNYPSVSSSGYTGGSRMSTDTHSTTRSSMSFFSANNSSGTLVAVNQDEYNPNAIRPSTSSSSVSSRQSHNHHFPHPHREDISNRFSTNSTFSPDGFNLPQPSDDRVVDHEFLSLMQKRGWHHLPDQAQRQMLAYPAHKKWTLVHQDKLTEWQGEQKKKHQRTTQGMSTYGGDGNILIRASEEGSPEWYVKKVMDDSITSKQLQSLSVSLRTQPIR